MSTNKKAIFWDINSPESIFQYFMKGICLSFVYMHPMMKRPLAIDFESLGKKNLTEGDDDDVNTKHQ